MNLIDKARPYYRAAFLLIAKPATYEQHNGASQSFAISIRGLTEDDLFGAVMQQDMLAQFLWDDFAAAFPDRPRPQRYDRIRTATATYSVEAWKPATGNDPPVFWKCHVRGSTQ